MAKTRERLQVLQELSSGLTDSGDRTNLFRHIVEKSLTLLACDAASLYLKSDDANLKFEVAINKSATIAFEKTLIPISHRGLASYVFRTGEVLRLSDVADIAGDAPYSFSRSFDEQNGYHTRSMLVQPLRNSRGEVLGVIQMINKKRRGSDPWPSHDAAQLALMPAFDADDARLLESFAAVAATSIENAGLYKNIEALFEGFVVASVQAIESRDPTTRGHSDRVAILSVALAETISASQDSGVRDVRFTTAQISELRYAALLHDFGKIGVSEHVLNKEEKLSPTQKLKIQARLREFKQSAEIKVLRDYLAALSREHRAPTELELRRLEEAVGDFAAKVDESWATILDLNRPSVLNEDRSKALRELEHLRCADCTGATVPLLHVEEIASLKILKGSLSESERRAVESHVTFTHQFLQRIPWTRELARVPAIAHAHHEYLDGSGYPRKIKGAEIPPQSQLMTICDIFDALVANDRPYKPALPFDRALEILGMESRAGRLNPLFLNIFIEAKLWHHPNFVALRQSPGGTDKRAV